MRKNNDNLTATGNAPALSTRQLCFLLAFFCPVNKLILMPSALARAAGNDLLISAGIVYVLQFLAVFALLFVMQKTDCTLFELIQNKFGAIAARIVIITLGVYLLFSAVLPVAEHRLYVQDVMYDTLPSFLIFIPFFLFAVYASGKGLRCLGRSADVGMPLFLLSFPVLLFMAFASADFTSILPVGGTSAVEIFDGAKSILGWFTEPAWLLLLLGNVKVEKKFLLKTSLSYALGGVAVLLFLAIFYGIFSTVAVNEPFAIAKIARYYNALKTLGRVDYLFLYLLSLVQLFALVAPLQLATHAIAKGCNYDNPPLFSLVVGGALFAVIYFTANAFPTLERTINGVLFPVFLLFSTLIPLLCLFFLMGRQKQGGTPRYEK